MGYSKTFLVLGLVFAVVLLISSHVSARQLAEAAQTREFYSLLHSLTTKKTGKDYIYKYIYNYISTLNSSLSILIEHNNMPCIS
jgi:hypothetical protein